MKNETAGGGLEPQADSQRIWLLASWLWQGLRPMKAEE